MRFLSFSVVVFLIVALSPLASAYVPVIDPGHGGVDGGAVGAGKIIESTLNLEISLRLKYLFLFTGVEPVILRETDISLHSENAATIRQKKNSDLANRIAMVNAVEDGLLISVHQNSFSDSRYGGAQIFFGSEKTKPLADTLQQYINERIDPENSRAAKLVRGDVYLFKKITRPAILVECGFLTNAQDLQKLQQPSHQKKLTTAVVSAFLAFNAAEE